MKEINIKLRPFDSSDRKCLAELANNKKIWDNLRDAMPYPYSEKDAEDFIKMCLSKNPMTFFAIECNGELVGSIALALKTDVYRKSAEIGYWIGEPYWGKGIATTAIGLIVDFGFKNLDIVRIDIGIYDYNRASQRILEKNGFTKEAIFKKAVFKNGKFCDKVRYGIIEPSC